MAWHRQAFEEDPHEFVHKANDPTEDFLSPRVPAINCIIDLAKYRGKDILPRVRAKPCLVYYMILASLCNTSICICSLFASPWLCLAVCVFVAEYMVFSCFVEGEIGRLRRGQESEGAGIATFFLLHAQILAYP